VDICPVPEEENDMFRLSRIVPTTVLTAAALALAAPGAQAKPLIAPSGGPNDVSPIVQSIQAANAEKQAKTVVVTTADKPLPNPVELPASTVASVPESSGDSFDWTAAAIGAGLGGIVMLMLAGGFGVRRRGQLAA
jgi:hypothetical protein